MLGFSIGEWDKHSWFFFFFFLMYKYPMPRAIQGYNLYEIHLEGQRFLGSIAPYLTQDLNLVGAGSWHFLLQYLYARIQIHLELKAS